MKKITTMKELLNERLLEEDIIKLVSNYDNKFSELEKENKEKQKEIERLNNIINELENDLIEYFKKQYPDRKLEDYNLEYCTYDYALVIFGKLQELKGEKQ